jgi:hypothetical protein
MQKRSTVTNPSINCQDLILQSRHENHKSSSTLGIDNFSTNKSLKPQRLPLARDLLPQNSPFSTLP